MVWVVRQNAKIDWRAVFFKVGVPVTCFVAAGLAYYDGKSLGAIGLVFIGWLYFLYFVGRQYGEHNAMRLHCAASAILLIGMGLYFLPFQNLDIAGSYLITGCIMGLVSAIAGIHVHIKRLEAPRRSGNRAADFPGIYCIRCRANGKEYIGQTSQPINNRWQEHRHNLQANRHHNRWLQADWNTYRSEVFEFRVLEVVTDPVWLLDRERHWQDVDYDPANRYNPPNIAAYPRKTFRRKRPSV